jgi:LacI family transcriptional regulator
MPPNVTIADIAREAGVGTATVDRVLNRRPGVHPETERKVLDAMAKLGATPPQRGRPRSGENFRFVFVLPAARMPFFDLVDRLIAQAAGDFRHQHITELTNRFDASDPAQFAADLAKLEDCDGIALLAPDVPPIKLAVNELVRAGVHVVTLFSDVAGSMRETYIGADNRAAGRVAGLLLGRMAAAPERSTLILASQATRLSSEIDRRVGFAQVIEEKFPHLQLQRINELPDGDDEAGAAFAKFLAGQADAARIAGVYNVGAGSYGLARALEARGLTDRIGLVAHDLTETNRTLLAAGRYSYILHQDVHYCVLTAARVLRALCENVRGALSVVQPRVEILTSENLS